MIKGTKMSKVATKTKTKNKRREIFSVVFVSLLLITTPAFAAPADGFPWLHWATGMVNFFIFAYIIYHFGGTAIKEMFAARKETFLADMNAAKKAREEAEERLAELNEKLEAFEQERQGMLDEYHAQGEREKQRIIEAAKRQVEKMRVDATSTIDQEVKKAVAMLEEQAVNRAVELARTKAIEAIDAQKQEELFEGYLSELKRPEASVN